MDQQQNPLLWTNTYRGTWTLGMLVFNFWIHQLIDFLIKRKCKAYLETGPSQINIRHEAALIAKSTLVFLIMPIGIFVLYGVLTGGHAWVMANENLVGDVLCGYIATEAYDLSQRHDLDPQVMIHHLAEMALVLLAFEWRHDIEPGVICVGFIGVIGRLFCFIPPIIRIKSNLSIRQQVHLVNAAIFLLAACLIIPAGLLFTYMMRFWNDIDYLWRFLLPVSYLLFLTTDIPFLMYFKRLHHKAESGELVSPLAGEEEYEEEDDEESYYEDDEPPESPTTGTSSMFMPRSTTLLSRWVSLRHLEAYEDSSSNLVRTRTGVSRTRTGTSRTRTGVSRSHTGTSQSHTGVTQNHTNISRIRTGMSEGSDGVEMFEAKRAEPDPTNS